MLLPELTGLILIMICLDCPVAILHETAHITNLNPTLIFVTVPENNTLYSSLVKEWS